MRKTFVLGVSLALVALSGCASHPAVQKSPASTAASPTPSAQVTVEKPSGQAFTTNSEELDFIHANRASCLAAQSLGVIFTFKNGRTLMPPALRFDDPQNTVFVPTKGPAIVGYFPDQSGLCNPSDLADSYALDVKQGGKQFIYAEHSFTKLDANTFEWRQHYGGVSLEPIRYTLKSGRVVGVDFGGASYSVTYGPLSASDVSLVNTTFKQAGSWKAHIATVAIGMTEAKARKLFASNGFVLDGGSIKVTGDPSTFILVYLENGIVTGFNLD